MHISFETPYHTFIKHENIKTIAIYNRFQNWIQGEFDLYQMEELDSLKVYYPNGWFSIRVLLETELDLNIEIKIKSRTINSGILIESKINKIHTHLNQVYENEVKKVVKG